MKAINKIKYIDRIQTVLLLILNMYNLMYKRVNVKYCWIFANNNKIFCYSKMYIFVDMQEFEFTDIIITSDDYEKRRKVYVVNAYLCASIVL